MFFYSVNISKTNVGPWFLDVSVEIFFLSVHVCFSVFLFFVFVYVKFSSALELLSDQYSGHIWTHTHIWTLVCFVYDHIHISSLLDLILVHILDPYAVFISKLLLFSSYSSPKKIIASNEKYSLDSCLEEYSKNSLYSFLMMMTIIYNIQLLYKESIESQIHLWN